MFKHHLEMVWDGYGDGKVFRNVRRDVPMTDEAKLTQAWGGNVFRVGSRENPIADETN